MNYIKEEIVIDFELNELLKNTIEELEEYDKSKNIAEYNGLAEMIDVIAKEMCRKGKITKEQWDRLCCKYPIV